MSNLTKEECLNALRGLEILEREEIFKKWNQVAPLIKCDVIEQLINEHFKCDQDCRNCWKFKIVEKCNPPLEFLDVEEGDWIWNNASKEYIKVLNRYVYQGKGMLVIKNHLRNHPEEIRFVEGRFYRKQVEENVDKRRV